MIDVLHFHSNSGFCDGNHHHQHHIPHPMIPPIASTAADCYPTITILAAAAFRLLVSEDMMITIAILSLVLLPQLDYPHYAF
jgi:hypothetical protein